MSKIKNTKTLTTCAMLVALAVILGFFRIPVTNIIEIRFGSLPLAVAGSFYGPAVAGIVGGISDILAFAVKPTGPFFPGFTISSILSAVIFGLVLRRKNQDVTAWRIILAEILHTFLVGLLLNSYNLFLLYGSPAGTGMTGYLAILSSRLVKELVMFPVNTALLFMVLKPLRYVEKYVLQDAHS